ncbi:MAG TPA: glycosyltransferase family 1 protein [Mobilitalea sp.]|nr:glycosyltransferase family 1 protein [Mobilitalea sp.]
MESGNGPVKILFVNGNAMDRGGIEAFLMNYYRHMDRSKIQCDFIVHGDKEGIYNDEIEKLGGRIYHVPMKSKHPILYQNTLRKIFSSGGYRIIHSHLDAMNCWVLKIAKECGIPVRIAHSHNTNHLTNNKLKLFINEYARKNITKYATHYYACSDAAGRWLYGDSWGDEKSLVINNAIDFSLYEFNDKLRKQYRQRYRVDKDFVLGHIGRFSYQKNHMFLLEVFARLHSERKDTKLVLIGEGENRKGIEEKITELGIAGSVLLLGSKSNAYDFYQMMDLFLLPSRFEGLPVVAVEAQVNGLTCFMSENITKEVCMTDRVKLIGIEQIEPWVEAIKNYMDNYSITGRKLKQIDLMNSYNIELAAKRLESLYLSYI